MSCHAIPSPYTLFNTLRHDSAVPLMSNSALSGCGDFLWPPLLQGLYVQPAGVWLVADILPRVADQNHPFTFFGSRSGRFSQPLKSHSRPLVQMYGASSVVKKIINQKKLRLKNILEKNRNWKNVIIPKERLTIRVVEINIEDKRGRGRPNKRWINEIEWSNEDCWCERTSTWRSIKI